MTISRNAFVKTAPVYDPKRPKQTPTEPILNPQTSHLCEKLGIDDPIQVVMARSGRTMKQVTIPDASKNTNDQVNIDNQQVESTPKTLTKMSLPAPVTPSSNENYSKHDIHQYNTSTPDNSFLSEDGNNTSSCMTPPSATKKVFKRRNLSMYTTEEDDCNVNESSSPDSISPRSSKFPCRSSEF